MAPLARHEHPWYPTCEKKKIKTLLTVLKTGSEIEKGETVYEYIGEGPPKGSGKHRYVYLLYQQRTGKVDVNEMKLSNKSQDNRAGKKVKR
jgi:phosphatidylethanolamine-binding protein (PEBP) family uncharacterized protein